MMGMLSRPPWINADLYWQCSHYNTSENFLGAKDLFVSVLLVAAGNKDKSFEGERIPAMYILNVLEADVTV